MKAGSPPALKHPLPPKGGEEIYRDMRKSPLGDLGVDFRGGAFDVLVAPHTGC